MYVGCVCFGGWYVECYFVLFESDDINFDVEICDIVFFYVCDLIDVMGWVYDEIILFE